MFTLLLIPLVMSCMFWLRQRCICLEARAQAADLVLWKNALRGVTSLEQQQFGVFDPLSRESRERGLRCAPALIDGLQWLRASYLRAEKINRLRLMWVCRAAAVVVLAAGARIFLLGSVGPALLGLTSIDSLLLAFAAMVLGASSFVFSRLLPFLKSDAVGSISGLTTWLRQRIGVENGLHEAELTGLIELESEERKHGISLRDEKIEVLAAFWRNRISHAEARGDAAAELMPVCEFVGFGLCLTLALLPAFIGSMD